MIKANELRVGNYFYLNTIDENCQPVKILTQANSMFIRDCEHYGEKWTGEPIPLSEDILLGLGFEKNPNYAIGNPLNLSLGRNKMLVVSSVGTPNEMVFVREENESNGVADEPDIVVVRNYDYNGKTYLHHIQNIAFDFGTELTLNP